MICATAAGLAPSAQAQNAAQADDSGLEEIVFTAKRCEQQLTKVPVSVQAVRAVTLQKQAFPSLVDALKLTPSLNCSAGAGGPAGSGGAIRGITSQTI